MALIQGVGVNDLDYPITLSIGNKTIWICPFYRRWSEMLKRCYSKNYHLKKPSYQECSVVDDWRYLSKFKAWMEDQDWYGKQLDKDILIPGNRIYSPESCVFVCSKTNNFLIDRKAGRGDWPIGVNLDKKTKMFRAQCMSVEEQKNKYLGLYSTPDLAHMAWRKFKHGQAEFLASLQSDPRVAKALRERYAL